ncbi:MAG TPA: nucleotide exchange factor GrpE [Pyrinomonadaceae bacterium]|jgi:molecular chaperone GrpE|nr:nucleotide exchange factor GrpE [Chloracidobacterium sp.]MBP9936912.1 nucleotide exchange factor GrpE [Pyrinomonadaceae bacterium]MBK7803384.1 nucleotide exchange factor GrpE [Chloracidobacterium sp.]MBK9766688.1 nucleotide exchange factor GrpE [Chloracidobacterium sp.]MBL0241160.1 nucleotide exchange factor GrpE [Chloracidobacterium sp.]
MNLDENMDQPQDPLEMIEADETSSVDDFIRELEAKEKDLHITSDLRIEIEDADFEISAVPGFVQQELSVKPAVKLPPVLSPVTKARNHELESEIAALKVRVLELKTERSDMQEKSDRRLKDFENFKYRMDRERRGSFIDQIGNLAGQMLPVLDNLHRAIDAADEIGGERGRDFQQFFDGIVLVNQQLNDIFAGMGVTPIATVGEQFDPHFHEAVATEVRPEMPANTISDELLRGYRIGNRVIRHSMVKVIVLPGQAAAPSEIPATAPADIPETDATSE